MCLRRFNAIIFARKQTRPADVHDSCSARVTMALDRSKATAYSAKTHTTTRKSGISPQICTCDFRICFLMGGGQLVGGAGDSGTSPCLFLSSSPCGTYNTGRSTPKTQIKSCANADNRDLMFVLPKTPKTPSMSWVKTHKTATNNEHIQTLSSLLGSLRGPNSCFLQPSYRAKILHLSSV